MANGVFDLKKHIQNFEKFVKNNFQQNSFKI